MMIIVSYLPERVLVIMMYHSLSLFKWGPRTEKTLILYVQLTE